MVRPLTGRGVLFWLFGFFGVIVAVNVCFAVISVKTFSGEDEQKPYLQGVEYNDTLARRAEQEKLGWKAAVSAVRQASGKVRFTVALRRADGSPEDGAVLRGELRHPASEYRDRPLDLKQTAPGRYEEELAGVAPGAWDVIVNNRRAQAPFEATRRLWVP